MILAHQDEVAGKVRGTGAREDSKRTTARARGGRERGQQADDSKVRGKGERRDSKGEGLETWRMRKTLSRR